MNALIAVIVLTLVRIAIPAGFILVIGEWVQKHQNIHQLRW